MRIKELRKICQDKGYKEHPASRFYRIFSIYITRIFILLRVKPNFVTAFGFLLGIAGGYFYLRSNFVLGSALFCAFIVLDSVDGEIARYRKLSSNFGGWLDGMAGHILYFYFFFTLGLGIFFQTGLSLYLILGSVAAMLKLLERSISQPLVKAGDYNEISKRQNIVSVKIWLSHIGKNLILYPVILLCSIAGWQIYFLWFFAFYLIFLAFGKIFLIGWRIYSSEK